MIKNYQNLSATERYIILVNFIEIFLVFCAELKILVGIGVIE